MNPLARTNGEHMGGPRVTKAPLGKVKCQSYRVGSANFSRRKLGHAHDNYEDSESVASAREPNVHAHFIFRFENGQGNQSFFFLSMTKNR